LSGGAVYLKAKKKDPEINISILLKNSQIKINEDHKKKFAIEIESCGESYLIATESEEERKEWHTAISDNHDKEPGSSGSAGPSSSKKKQSTAMRVKKNVGGNIATSSTGKSLIREFVGKDGVKIIEIVKKVVSIYDSKKRADDVENVIIRIAVKVILLWKNKDITNENIVSIIPKVKAVWSDAIDFAEMSFAYDPAKLKDHADLFIQSLY